MLAHVLSMKTKWMVNNVMGIVWASRITLEITNVRVKRVQDITVDDAIKEGIPIGSYGWFEDGSIMDERDLFANLWNSINAKRGFGWDQNPWAWVIEFERIV